MEEETEISLEAFESALARLIDALDQVKTEWTRDAAIQRFEFTYELAWKSIARFARREGIECVSPLQAFRAALRLRWIEDDDLWLGMRDDRNRTSHTYSESVAESIYERLPSYTAALTKLIARLRPSTVEGVSTSP